MPRRAFVACMAGAALTLTGCATDKQPEQQSKTFFAFDTVITVKASCSSELLDSLEQRCAFYESIFSRTDPKSDIGRLNAAAGEPTDVDAETIALVTAALDYCKESGGLFDITIGAVSSLWDFHEGIVPNEAALAEAVTHVDYRNVRLDDGSITLLDPGAKLDLGGIAKGYIADRLIEMLEDEGCTSGFVNLGGNVKTLGARPDGSAWNVGIQDPAGESQDVIAQVSSRGTSIVTSGLYERQFELDGRRYWHILDPRTGYPVGSDLVSATIVSAASIDGDGYTKPLFMMGSRDALIWLNAHPEFEGLLITADGMVLKTDNSTIEEA